MKYQNRSGSDPWQDATPSQGIANALDELQGEFGHPRVKVSIQIGSGQVNWRIKPRDEDLLYHINEITRHRSETEAIYQLLEERGLV